MLPFYAARFPTVEINNTFYRLPKESVVMDWATAVPDGFTFSIKASQRITHHARLKDTEELMSYLLRVCTALGDKRGPTLFQLPPNMKLDSRASPHSCRSIPRRWKAAIEFRHRQLVHRGGVRPPAPARGGARRRRERGRGGASSSRRRRTVISACTSRPIPPASSTPGRPRSSAQPWEEAWIYFKHDNDTAGPELAAAFAARFA